MLRWPLRVSLIGLRVDRSLREESLEMITEAIESHIELLTESGDVIPPSGTLGDQVAVHAA